MLPKKERLPIQSVVRLRGRSFPSNDFLVKFFNQTDPTLINSRFGVVVSARVFKKAVLRNNLKRLVYNILRSVKAGLPIGDYLIIPNKGVRDKDSMEFKKSLVAVFESIIKQK